jgi:hypothetical protein
MKRGKRDWPDKLISILLIAAVVIWVGLTILGLVEKFHV